MAIQRKFSLHVAILTFLTLAIVLSGLARAENTTANIKLEKLVPSKDLIEITYAPKIAQGLLDLEKSKPAQAVSRRQVIKMADTFLQRYMNGDLNEVELPWDWTAYNSPIMGVDWDGWRALNGRQWSPPSPHSWKLCPVATMVSLTPVSKTVADELDRVVPFKGVEVRYELVIVGSFATLKGSKLDVFFDAEKGQVFAMNVTLDQRAKVVDLVIDPRGREVEPFDRDIEQFQQYIDPRGGNLSRYSEKRIADLQQAAEVCKLQTQGR